MEVDLAQREYICDFQNCCRANSNMLNDVATLEVKGHRAENDRAVVRGPCSVLVTPINTRDEYRFFFFFRYRC